MLFGGGYALLSAVAVWMLGIVAFAMMSESPGSRDAAVPVLWITIAVGVVAGVVTYWKHVRWRWATLDARVRFESEEPPPTTQEAEQPRSGA